MAFQALSRVQAKVESIQDFFEKIADLFYRISVVGQHLHGDNRLNILREKIVQVYDYSLQICAAIINNKNGRLSMCSINEADIANTFCKRDMD